MMKEQIQSIFAIVRESDGFIDFLSFRTSKPDTESPLGWEWVEYTSGTLKTCISLRKRLDTALDDIDWMERNMTINDFPEPRP